MITNIIFLFLSLLFTLNINAQPPKHIKAKQSLAPFTGTWVGTSDNVKYEITFKEGIRKLELNGNRYTMEVVFASSIKWYKNEKLIREYKTEAPRSILEGSVSDTNPLFLDGFIYYDKEKEYSGSGTFKIDDAKNPQKAIFNLGPSYIGKNKGKMDFPALFELTKVK